MYPRRFPDYLNFLGNLKSFWEVSCIISVGRFAGEKGGDKASKILY